MKRIAKVLAMLVCAGMLIVSCNNASTGGGEYNNKNVLDLRNKLNGVSNFSMDDYDVAARSASSPRAAGDPVELTVNMVESENWSDNNAGGEKPSAKFIDNNDGLLIKVSLKEDAGMGGYKIVYIDGNENGSSYVMNENEPEKNDDGVYEIFYPFVAPNKEIDLLVCLWWGNTYSFARFKVKPLSGRGIIDDLPPNAAYSSNITLDRDGNFKAVNIKVPETQITVEYAWYATKTRFGLEYEDAIMFPVSSKKYSIQDVYNFSTKTANLMNFSSSYSAANSSLLDADKLKEIKDRPYWFCELSFWYRVKGISNQKFYCPHFFSQKREVVWSKSGSDFSDAEVIDQKKYAYRNAKVNFDIDTAKGISSTDTAFEKAKKEIAFNEKMTGVWTIAKYSVTNSIVNDTLKTEIATNSYVYTYGKQGKKITLLFDSAGAKKGMSLDGKKFYTVGSFITTKDGYYELRNNNTPVTKDASDQTLGTDVFISGRYPLKEDFLKECNIPRAYSYSPKDLRDDFIDETPFTGYVISKTDGKSYGYKRELADENIYDIKNADWLFKNKDMNGKNITITKSNSNNTVFYGTVKFNSSDYSEISVIKN